MNRVSLRCFGWTTVAVLMAGLAAPAPAQEPGDLQRAVARISLMDGQVSVRRGDSGDWVAGVINAPLMADDRIAVGPDSRAEVELDASNVVDLGGTSEIHLAALEYGRYQLELAHGTATYRILRTSDANIEVDTPSVSARPSKVGSYRITVKDNGETEVTARAGDLEVFTPRGSQWVSTGQMMVARGSASDPEFQIATANPYDDWDRWCDSRGQAIAQSPSYQYVPQGVYGTEDLDNSGTWVDYPEYGHVWRPAVDASWSPYGCGQWVWEDWYGWTWVGCESWGWAPYHYGRWFWGANYGWLWYPGVLGVRHYWSPALVGFFGFGGGVGVGFGFGNVGWVALAPYEMFHPWWGRGFYGRDGFNRGFDFSHGNVLGVYRNARMAHGVSAVSVADFRSGRFGSIIRPGGQDLRSAGMVHGAMAISPTNASLHYRAGRQVAYVPRGSQSQHFFAHQPAPTVQHSPYFQSQRGANGFAGNRGGMERGANPGPDAPAIGRPQAPAAQGGWRRFGQSQPNQAGASRPENNGYRGGQAPGSSNGYERFGEPGGGRAYQGAGSAPRYGAPPARNEQPRYSAPQQQRYNEPPARNEQPRYSAPQQQRYNEPPARNEQPRYSAPQQQRYNEPPARSNTPSAPRYNAPARSGGGGGGGHFGGGGHPSGGGGGGHRR